MDNLSSRIEKENENRDMFLFVEAPIVTSEVSGNIVAPSNDMFGNIVLPRKYDTTDSVSPSSNNDNVQEGIGIIVPQSKFQTVLTFIKKNIFLNTICISLLLITGVLLMATSKHKIENENLKQKIEILSKEKVSMENKYTEVLTELEKVRTESQNQINVLNTNIENIRTLCKEAREHLDTVNKQLETLKEEHQKVLSKNTELSNTVQTLENDLNKAQPKQSFFRKLWPFK